VEVLKNSGSKGIILTAKHHDGFCLWQTETTEYSIKNSPYKGGSGDIVAELAASCQKNGLKFGVYLSPWDRNCNLYGTNAYNDFFVDQLTELLTNYGEIFSVWFDGARGKEVEVDEDFKYDFDRYYQIIRELQPNAVIAISGPDVRWIGNEAGIARESEWSVVSEGEANPDKVAAGSQNDEDMADELQNITRHSSDLGSRELLKYYDNLIWYPAEVDVSIRKGWFYHQNQKPKDLQHLLKIYYKAVGGNSSLLLNVPVNKEGLICSEDEEVLKQFGNTISTNKVNLFDYSVYVGNASETALKQGQGSENIKADNFDGLALDDSEYIIDLKLQSPKVVKFIDIREDIRYSQRVELFDVYAKVEGGWLLLSNNTNIGNRRIIALDPEGLPSSDTIRIVFRQSRGNPIIGFIGLY
jgi:alpha-L-fucosidase